MRPAPGALDRRAARRAPPPTDGRGDARQARAAVEAVARGSRGGSAAAPTDAGDRAVGADRAPTAGLRLFAGTGRTIGPGPWRSTQPTRAVGGRVRAGEDGERRGVAAVGGEGPAPGARRADPAPDAGGGRAARDERILLRGRGAAERDGRQAAARDRGRRAVGAVAVGLVGDRQRGLRERHLHALVVGAADRAAAADLDQHVAEGADAQRQAGGRVAGAVAATDAGARTDVGQLRHRLAGAGLDERCEVDDVQRPARLASTVSSRGVCVAGIRYQTVRRNESGPEARHDAGSGVASASSAVAVRSVGMPLTADVDLERRGARGRIVGRRRRRRRRGQRRDQQQRRDQRGLAVHRTSYSQRGLKLRSVALRRS